MNVCESQSVTDDDVSLCLFVVANALRMINAKMCGAIGCEVFRINHRFN